MNKFQYICGLLILILGTIVGLLLGNVMLAVICVVGGFVLISLSELVRLVQEMNHKMLGVPLTKDQITTIIQHSRHYYVYSQDLDVHPDPGTAYTFIVLDGEHYIRARVFLPYIRQQEFEYTFTLPDRDPVVMHCSNDYYKGVDLFGSYDQVIVKLSALGLKWTVLKDTLRIHNPKNA